MNTDVIDTRITPGSTIKPRILDGLAKRALLNRLNNLRDGELIINENGNEYRFGEQSNRCSISVEISVKDTRFYGDIAFGGSIGAGEA